MDVQYDMTNGMAPSTRTSRLETSMIRAASQLENDLLLLDISALAHGYLADRLEKHDVGGDVVTSVRRA